MSHVRAVYAFCAMGLLSGCDHVIASSRYNVTENQITALKEVDIPNLKEFKVDMPSYLADQLAKLDAAFASSGFVKSEKSPSEACSLKPKSQIESFAKEALLAGEASPQAQRVASVALRTATMGLPVGVGALKDEDNALSLTDFEEFRRWVSDSGSVAQPALWAGVAELSPSPDSLLSSTVKAYASEENSEKKGPPLLGYWGAYYKGGFVDRLGNKIDKPNLKNGIDNGTIANFIRVLLEFGADSVSPEPVLADSAESPTKYYPKGKGKESMPTFYAVFKAQEGDAFRKIEKIVATNDDGTEKEAGVTAAESRFIEAGSNLIAEQGLVAASGILEFLSSIDVGFVIAPNFAVGDNDTLKTVARSVIETSLRRGAQLGVYCLVEKYDLNKFASVIGDD